MENNFYNFHPEKIKIINLIPMGRSSSIFFQGLLDSHPQIVTILGNFYIEEEDIKQKTIEKSCERVYNRIENILGYYHKTIDLKKEFPLKTCVDYVKEYITEFNFNKKTLYIGIHYAFAKHFKMNLKEIKYILAHSHGPPLFFEMVNEFPRQKVILTLRDPRANYYSFKKINMLFFGVLYQKEAYILYNRIKKSKLHEVMVIRHEDLHIKYDYVKNKLLKYLDIPYSETLESSTSFNKPYDGSTSIIKSTQNHISAKPDKKFVSEVWKENLSTYEIRFVQEKFSQLMKEFGYKKMNPYKNIVINILGCRFSELNDKNIQSNKGIKKFVLRSLQNIYKIPIFGFILVYLFLLAFYFIIGFRTIYRVIFYRL